MLTVFAATLVAAAALAPFASAVPVLDDRSVATQAAFRLLSFENADGSWPYQVAPSQDGCGCQNVAGVTALGLLDAYALSGTAQFFDGAAKTFDYLAAIHAADPANRLSAPNVLFLVEFALVSGDATKLSIAREAYLRQLAFHGNDPRALAGDVLDVRAGQGIGNVGFWDVGLFAQAATAAGAKSDANDMAALATSRASELSATSDYYSLGLAGLVTANAWGSIDSFETGQAWAATLVSSSDGNGGYGDVQQSSYAAMALYAIGDVANARRASTHVHDAWNPTVNGWPEGGAEFAEVDSEAIQALAHAVLPVPAEASSYALTLASGLYDAAANASPPGGNTCAGYPVTPATPDGTGPYPTDCAPAESLVYAWVCVGYSGNVDHFGASLGFPHPGVATAHPLQDAAIAQAIATDAAGGTFDPANLVTAASFGTTSTGTCSQTLP